MTDQIVTPSNDKILTLTSEHLPTFGASTAKDPSLKPSEPIRGAKGEKVKMN
jgi:hypothetical protein